jgi:hypothetical protein
LEFVAPAPPAASAFTDLTDVPAAYTGAAGKLVSVNVGESGLTFIDHGPTAFTGLSDVPGNYTGAGLKGVRVKTTADGLEFYTRSLVGLSDFPANYTGAGGKGVRVNAGATAVEFYTIPAPGSTSFIGLTDVPAAFTGAGGKKVKVNSGATALEFDPDTFIGLGDVPAAFTGSGGFLVAVKSDASALEFIANTTNKLVLSVWVDGILPNDGEEIYANICVTAYTALAGTYTGARLRNAPSGTFSLTLFKGVTSFGTISFSSGSTNGTITIASDTAFAAGDVLRVVVPTGNSTAGYLAVSLKGTF